jgi:hypothetical protein
MQHRYELR